MKNTTPKQTEINSGSNAGGTLFEHNAFGSITVVKTNCSGEGAALFGSNLTHNQMITIEVSTADLTRIHGSEYIHADKTLVRFAMSEAQWARFVSSIGNGNGIPITLQYAPQNHTLLHCDGIVPNSIKKMHEADIAADMKRLMETGNQAMKALEALKSKKTISKTDLNEAYALMSTHLANLPSNAAFMEKQFNRAMEKTISDGKIEIETFMTNTLIQTGLESIQAAKDLTPKLTNTFDPD